MMFDELGDDVMLLVSENFIFNYKLYTIHYTLYIIHCTLLMKFLAFTFNKIDKTFQLRWFGIGMNSVT